MGHKCNFFVNLLWAIEYTEHVWRNEESTLLKAALSLKGKALKIVFGCILKNILPTFI